MHIKKIKTLSIHIILLLYMISFSNSSISNTDVSQLNNSSINWTDYQEIMKEVDRIVGEKEQIKIKRSEILNQINADWDQAKTLKDLIARGEIQMVKAYSEYYQVYIKCKGLVPQNGSNSLNLNDSCLQPPNGPQADELNNLYQQRTAEEIISGLNQRQLQIQSEFTRDSSSVVELYADLLLYFRQKQSNKTSSVIARNLYNILNIKRVGVAKFAREQIIAQESLKQVVQQSNKNGKANFNKITTLEDKLTAGRKQCQSNLVKLKLNWKDNLANLISIQANQGLIKKKIDGKFAKVDEKLTQLKKKTAELKQLQLQLVKLMKLNPSF